MTLLARPAIDLLMKARFLRWLLFLELLGFILPSPVQAAAATNRIAGTVMEVRGGTPDVTLILCDQNSGLPVTANTFQPFTESRPLNFPPQLATTLSGARGSFAFTNVPPGEYRIVAQKWTGPFKGIFELHGGVIQLFGVADHIRVPSPEAETLSLSPPGDSVLVLDLAMPNNGTLMVLSTKPLLADPILGFHAPGTNFLSHAIGLNVMPYGRTTVVGLPKDTIHAWFFVNDNSPGFAADTYEMREPYLRAPQISFVAGWSDGRHDPPERLKTLSVLLSQHGVTPYSLLGMDKELPMAKQLAQLQKFYGELDRRVALPNGDFATMSDLIALISYEQLKKGLQSK